MNDKHSHINYDIVTPLEELPKEERKAVLKKIVDDIIEEGNVNQNVSDFAGLNESSVMSYGSRRRARQVYCRLAYQQELDKSRWRYLYNEVEKKKKDGQLLTLRMPAKVRSMPIVRPKIRRILAQHYNNPLIFQSFGVDQQNLEDKRDAQIDKRMLERRAFYYEQKTLQAMIEQGIQTQQMLLQEQMQNPEIANDPQFQQLVKQIEMEVQQITEMLHIEGGKLNDRLDAVNNMFKNDYRSAKEDLIDRALTNYISDMELKDIFNKSMEEKMIHGEPVMYVDWQPPLKRPETRVVNPEYFWYQYNENAKYISECDWAAEYQPMSFGNFVSLTQGMISKDELDEIRSLAEMNSGGSFQGANNDITPSGVFVNNGKNNRNSYMFSQNTDSTVIDVFKCYIKVPTPVHALITKNNNPSNVFDEKPDYVKFITAEQAKKMTSTKPKRDRLAKQGKKVVTRYRNDLWEVWRVFDTVYPVMRKRSVQYRTETNVSDVPLPYTGRAVHKFYQPFSVIWETKDVVDLFNILYFHQELYVALSGVRGLIYDLSQKPKGMKTSEIMYYLKNGIAPVETIDPITGKPKNPQFNQFSNYDNSLTPSISVLIQARQELEQLIGSILGVNRQMTGQVLNQDAVGNNKIALQQGNAVIESYFQEQEKLEEHVLSRLANLFPLAYAKGYTGATVLGDFSQENLIIPRKSIEGNFKVKIKSGFKEASKKDELKQIAQMKFAQERVTLKQYVELMENDSIAQMKKLLIEFEEKALSVAQMNQQSQQEYERNLKQMDHEMAMQLEQLGQQGKMQIEQLRAQVNQAKQQQDIMLAQMQNETQNKDIETRSRDNSYKVDTDAAIEYAYLEFQKTSLAVNAKQQRMQMLMDQAKNKIKLNKGLSKQKIKD